MLLEYSRFFGRNRGERPFCQTKVKSTSQIIKYIEKNRRFLCHFSVISMKFLYLLHKETDFDRIERTIALTLE